MKFARLSAGRNRIRTIGPAPACSPQPATERLSAPARRKIGRKFALGHAASANQPFPESGDRGSFYAPLRCIKEIPSRLPHRLPDGCQESSRVQLIADERHGTHNHAEALKRRLDREVEVLEDQISRRL